MNLAFPAVVIVLVIIPGYLCRRAFYLQNFRKFHMSTESLDASNFPVRTFESLFWAIPLHVIGILIAEKCLGYSVEIHTLVQLIADPSKLTSTDFLGLDQRMYSIFAYFAILSVAGFLLGRGSRRIIARCHWDHRIPYLRYENRWYYVLTGEHVFLYAEALKQALTTNYNYFEGEIKNTIERITKENDPAPKKIEEWGKTIRHSIDACEKLDALITLNNNDPKKVRRQLLESGFPQFVIITAVVEQAGTAYLYAGLFVEVIFRPGGEIDKLYLTAAQYKKLDRDDEMEDIVGDLLVIDYKNIRSLNIRYMWDIDGTDAEAKKTATQATSG